MEQVQKNRTVETVEKIGTMGQGCLLCNTPMKHLVSKFTARLAKKKGFNCVSDLFFNDNYPKGEENLNELTNYDNGKPRDNFFAWPYIYDLFDWLRDEHGVFIVLMPKITPRNDIVWYRYLGKEKLDWEGCYSSYHQALEVHIKEELKDLENVYTQQKGKVLGN